LGFSVHLNNALQTLFESDNIGLKKICRDEFTEGEKVKFWDGLKFWQCSRVWAKTKPQVHPKMASI